MTRDDRVLLWCWSVDAIAPGDLALLDPAERARADRFLSATHRTAYVRSHGGMRLVLGRILGCRPDTIAFAAGDHGKPRLAMGGPGFNLSHSAGLAALVVAGTPQIGIDIECIRPIEHEALAALYFSAAERAALAAVPAQQREASFFDGWTRKEAYLKARGTGLNDDLDGFTVSLAPGHPAALLDVEGSPEEAARWTIAGFTPQPGYAGAVAARASGWVLERRPDRDAWPVS